MTALNDTYRDIGSKMVKMILGTLGNTEVIFEVETVLYQWIGEMSLNSGLNR